MYGNTTVNRTDDVLDGPRITLSNVSPVQSFSRQFLAEAREPYLMIDGDTIIIDVDNGRWIWRIFAEDEHCAHARWPD
jgi:uncharacterized protein involved in tellurium resistance